MSRDDVYEVYKAALTQRDELKNVINEKGISFNTLFRKTENRIYKPHTTQPVILETGVSNLNRPS